MLNFPTDSAIAIAKPKHSMLPLLVVLFMVSYGLLAMLVVEQGRTIDAQRYLIRELFGDSTQLNAIKGHVQRQAQAKPRVQAPPAQAPNDKAGSKLRRVPERPPKATSDTADVRRSLISI